MAENNTDGRWVTLDNGVHLFIKKGQTLDDAIERLDAGKNERDKRKAFSGWQNTSENIKRTREIIKNNNLDIEIEDGLQETYVKGNKNDIDTLFKKFHEKDESGKSSKDRDEVYNAVNKSVEKLNKKVEETKKPKENTRKVIDDLINYFSSDIGDFMQDYGYKNKEEIYKNPEKSLKELSYYFDSDLEDFNQEYGHKLRKPPTREYLDSVDREEKKTNSKEKLDQHAKNVKEGKEKIEDEDYKGYSISHNFYGNGEYSVQFEGDDILFDSAEDAKAFIDKETNTEEKDDYKNLSAEEYGKKYQTKITDQERERIDDAKDWQQQLAIAKDINRKYGNTIGTDYLESYTSKPYGLQEALSKYYNEEEFLEDETIRNKMFETKTEKKQQSGNKITPTGDVKKDINKVIRDHFKGYSDEDFNEFWGDYINVDTEETKDGRTKIEVRGEFSYNEFDDLMQNGLDAYVQAIDKDAYFDQDEPGIISAYVDTKKLKNFKPNKTEKVPRKSAFINLGLDDYIKRYEYDARDVDDYIRNRVKNGASYKQASEEVKEKMVSFEKLPKARKF